VSETWVQAIGLSDSMPMAVAQPSIAVMRVRRLRRRFFKEAEDTSTGRRGGCGT
jgi:hypothetical protein